MFSNALKNGTVVKIRANTTAPNEPYTAHKGILPMSEPPLSNPWKIDQSRTLAILKKGQSSPSEAKRKAPSAIPGLVVLSLGAIASGMALIHYGNLVADNWNAQRETSAQTELARLQRCINN